MWIARFWKRRLRSAVLLTSGGNLSDDGNHYSITQGLFPIQRAGQSILFHGDRFRARVLDLVRLGGVELDVFREFRREVGLGVDGVHWAYLYACHAINAVFRVNDYLILHFVEARHW